jgi:hypothetical protein
MTMPASTPALPGDRSGAIAAAAISLKCSAAFGFAARTRAGRAGAGRAGAGRAGAGKTAAAAATSRSLRFMVLSAPDSSRVRAPDTS